MVDPVTLGFSIAAIIIFIGFAGDVIFRKTGIPPILFLLLVGVIIGPVFGFVPTSLITPLLPLFATLTLIMVLFYGGMTMRIRALLSNSGRTAAQVSIYVISSTVIIAYLLSYFLGWPLIEALIFGSIVGGETSGAVVVPLAMSMGFKESPKSFIMLESALNSVLTAVLFISFVTIYQIGTGININNAVNSLVSTFSTGIVVGLVVSLFWIFILHNLNRHRHIYVLTLGLLLITYSISEALGGSGIFSVLIFGVVLGNFKLFTIIFKKKVRILGVKERLFEFQGEMTFLLTTFFFVFLGLLFNISYSNLMYTLIFGGLTLLILLGARALAVNVSTYKSQLSKDKTSIFLMCAQGVTPLVLMSLAIVDGVQLASQFIPLVTFVIISTNLITIVGAVLRKRGIVRGSGVSSRLF